VYHPLLLTRLLLYRYSIGSSRTMEKATYGNVAFRYLADHMLCVLRIILLTGG
jgi:transposase